MSSSKTTQKGILRYREEDERHHQGVRGRTRTDSQDCLISPDVGSMHSQTSSSIGPILTICSLCTDSLFQMPLGLIHSLFCSHSSQLGRPKLWCAKPPMMKSAASYLAEAPLPACKTTAKVGFGKTSSEVLLEGVTVCVEPTTSLIKK